MKYILLLTLAAVTLIAADATGNWTGTLTPSDGAEEPGPALLVLKQVGNKLTGTAGPDANDQHAIENGKVDGGKLTFEVPAGGAVMRFSLRQEGEEIKGDIVREREGRQQTAKLAVKRDK